ncbi:MAG: hypothetical protein HW411_470 [Gammaproteobacteria bacterium]|nr:hypothetical protein [Gammaproteobacteria bacterium]
MQDRYCGIFLSLFIQVLVSLGLIVPAAGYADSTANAYSINRLPQGLSGSHRGLHGFSGSNRGLNRTQGQQISPVQDKRNTQQGNPRQQNDPRRNRHHTEQGNLAQNGNDGQINSQNQQGNPQQAENNDDRNHQGLSGSHRGLDRTPGQQIFPAQDKQRTRPENFRQQNEQGQNNRHIEQGNLTQNEKQGQIKHQGSWGNLNGYKWQGQHTHPKQHAAMNQHNNDEHKKDHWHHKKHKKHKHHGNFGYLSYNPYKYYSYRPYSYPYIYYSPMYSYSSPGYSSSNYSPPGDSYKENKYSSSKNYGIDSAGWTVLAHGQIQTALDIFAEDVKYFPNAGIPKVGYAIASAAAGDLTKGVMAMREAFHADPDSLHYLRFDDQVLAIINDLIEKYEDPLQENIKHPDEAFMVAALNYLKHNYGSAHEALERAIVDGDNSPSANNLHALIDNQLPNDYAGEYN